MMPLGGYFGSVVSSERWCVEFLETIVVIVLIAAFRPEQRDRWQQRAPVRMNDFFCTLGAKRADAFKATGPSDCGPD